MRAEAIRSPEPLLYSVGDLMKRLDLGRRAADSLAKRIGVVVGTRYFVPSVRLQAWLDGQLDLDGGGK